MKNIFSFLVIVFLLAMPASLAFDPYYKSNWIVGPPDYGVGTYKDGFFNFHQTPWAIGSGVYNNQRFGAEIGHNPFYARSTPSHNRDPNAPKAHIYIRNQLDYQIANNPDLLYPRHSTNYDRFLTAYDLRNRDYVRYTGSIRRGDVRGVFTSSSSQFDRFWWN